MQSSNANGAWTTYTWDAANRLEMVTDQRLGETSLFEHDAVGNPARVTYGNALQTDIARDLLYRVTRQDVVNAAAPVAFDYTLDPTGRRLSLTDADGRTADYQYDDTYKLTREDVTGDPSDDGALVYTYDPVGNRMELFSTLTAVPGATYTYDLNDRLDADTYDANGNTLASSGNTLAYDFEDRLLHYNSGEVVNVYDGDGNRVLRTRGASTTAYLIDELNPTGFAQVAEEITDGAVTATYALGTWRTHQVRWESGTAAPSYYGYDAHGNVRALLDANRSATDRYEYDAFGNLLATNGTTFNSYFYTGEQFDPTMGLYNLRARWYGPPAGRFATADKFEGPHFAFLCGCNNPTSCDCCQELKRDSTDPRHHFYLYAGADPVGNKDPSGKGFISFVSRLVSEIRVFVAVAQMQKQGVCSLLFAAELASCAAILVAPLQQKCLLRATFNNFRCLRGLPPAP